jgi:hypothetical protein
VTLSILIERVPFYPHGFSIRFSNTVRSSKEFHTLTLWSIVDKGAILRNTFRHGNGGDH